MTGEDAQRIKKLTGAKKIIVKSMNICKGLWG
jgi:hypothetical protein